MLNLDYSFIPQLVAITIVGILIMVTVGGVFAVLGGILHPNNE